MMTGTLPRYFGIRFFSSVVGSFLGVVVLAAMIDYVELMRRGADWPNATPWLLAKISMFRVPQLTERIMPFSVLVGTMSCYLNLSRRLELVVARAAGVSAWQFVMPAILGASFSAPSPPLSTIRSRRCCRSAPSASKPKWSAKCPRRCRRAPAASGCARRATTAPPSSTPRPSREQGAKLGGVSVYTFDAAGHFQQRIEARAPRSSTATGSSTTRASMRPASRSSSRTAYHLGTNLTLEQVRESFATPETVPFWQLPTYITMADRAGLRAAGYRLQYRSVSGAAVPARRHGAARLRGELALLPLRRRAEDGSKRRVGGLSAVRVIEDHRGYE